MHTHLGVLAVIVGLACAAGAAAAQAAPGPDFFGTNVQPMVKLQVVAPDAWGTFLDRQVQDGMPLARADAAWAWAEPDAPVDGVHAYSWDRPDDPDRSLDRVVGTLAGHGVRLTAVISSAPGWAGGGGREVTPDHFADMAAFAGAFAARYGGNGTFWTEHPELAALPVRDYEVWTEGNSTNSWSHTVDPADYVAGFRGVSGAIHGADPAGRVLASVGWDGYQSYVAQLYASGIAGFVDGMAFHPYGFRPVDVFGLVRSMRAALTAAGDPGLPIFATEIGFPAPDAATDERRAGALGLAGSALARSDCGVQDFLVYANVGGEADSPNEPIGESQMGIYRRADASATATGSALRNAALSWSAQPTAGIGICGTGTTPPRSLLPLGLTLDRPSARCVTAHGSYGGHPVEGLQLVLRTPWGPVGGALTDGTGSASACMASWAADPSFDVHAEIANVAHSPTLSCVVGRPTCAVSQPPPADGGAVQGGIDDGGPGSGAVQGGPGGTGGAATAAKPCRFRLSARIVRIRPAKTTARAALTCGGHRLIPMRVSLLIRKKGSKREKAVGRLRLKDGRTASFSVRRRLRPGDHLLLRRAAQKSTGVPRLVASVIATRRLGAR